MALSRLLPHTTLNSEYSHETRTETSHKHSAHCVNDVRTSIPGVWPRRWWRPGRRWWRSRWRRLQRRRRSWWNVPPIAFDGPLAFHEPATELRLAALGRRWASVGWRTPESADFPSFARSIPRQPTRIGQLSHRGHTAELARFDAGLSPRHQHAAEQSAPWRRSSWRWSAGCRHSRCWSAGRRYAWRRPAGRWCSGHQPIAGGSSRRRHCSAAGAGKPPRHRRTPKPTSQSHAAAAPRPASGPPVESRPNRGS